MYANIVEEVNGFVAMLKSTPEYLEYEKQRKCIADYPDLKRAADSIREQNFHIQTTVDRDKLAVEVMHLAYDRSEIYRKGMMHDYLEAEASFCRLMRDVLNGLLNGLDFQ